MTISLPGMAPPASLTLARPVVGFDPSTLRMSAGGLLGEEHRIRGDIERVTGVGDPALAVWDTISFWKTKTLQARQHLAHQVLVKWIRDLDVRWGSPELVAVEQPFSGGHHTEPTSFYIIGVLLAAIGEVWPEAELLMVVPGWWKARATGAGSVKGVRGVAEKRRILEWARECCGYTGDLFDESDAIGIATGAAVELERRRTNA